MTSEREEVPSGVLGLDIALPVERLASKAWEVDEVEAKPDSRTAVLAERLLATVWTLLAFSTLVQ